jgi:aspartate aminotransferase
MNQINFISERLKNMPVSSVRKLTPYVAPLKEQGVKIYHLNIGDPDVKTPDCMIDALKNWKENPIRYALSAGETSFIDAMLWYYKRFGYGFLKNADIVATVGGSEAIVMALFSVAEIGDEILVFEPFYSNYAVSASITGVKLVAVPTTIKNGFHLPDRKTIEAKISSKTKAIFYCNPVNPTGAIYTKEEIEMLVSIAKEHNLFLISDEVYREYVFEGKKAVSLLSYMQDMKDKAIMLDSLSKRYSLCGARLGLLVSQNQDLIKGVMKMAQGRLCGGLIDQYVGSKLTLIPDTYIKDVQKEYEKRRNILYEGLLTIPGVTTYKPEGAFYTMVGLPVKDSDDFCLWLLTKYKSNNETVMLAPGAGFYASPNMGRNEVRIAYVLKEADLKRAIEILREALEVYNGKN